jgi:hypothetical protein
MTLKFRDNPHLIPPTIVKYSLINSTACLVEFDDVEVELAPPLTFWCLGSSTNGGECRGEIGEEQRLAEVDETATNFSAKIGVKIKKGFA